MSYTPKYFRGDWKAYCDICGREYLASQLRKRWDGFMVCDDDWEIRHPQDFVRGVADIQAPPWTRPEPADVFVSGACTTRSAIVGTGYNTIGCMIVGNVMKVGATPSSSFNTSGTP